jgi:hypothetical protein
MLKKPANVQVWEPSAGRLTAWRRSPGAADRVGLCILGAIAAGSTAYAGTYGPLWLAGAAGVNLFVFAAVAAWYAMLAYRGQAAEMAEQRSFNAQQIMLARRQDETARTMARLEIQRRRDELTPEFDITCDGQFLYVILIGPQQLPGLQGAVIRIADEMWTDHGAKQTAGGPSAEDLAKIVWGPYEFNTAASANVTDQRTSRERAYDRTTGKNWDKLPLLPSSRPPWSSWTDQQWMNKYHGHPVRLVIECWYRHDTWIITKDVPVAPPTG